MVFFYAKIIALASSISWSFLGAQQNDTQKCCSVAFSIILDSYTKPISLSAPMFQLSLAFLFLGDSSLFIMI